MSRDPGQSLACAWHTALTRCPSLVLKPEEQGLGTGRQGASLLRLSLVAGEAVEARESRVCPSAGLGGSPFPPPPRKEVGGGDVS